MKRPVKMALAASLALAAILTTLAFWLERSRAAEIHANLAREHAEREHSVELILIRSLQDFLAKADTITPENFAESANRRAKNETLWQESLAAFAFYELIPEGKHAETRYFSVYGVAGLGKEDEKTRKLISKRKYAGEYILASERAKIIEHIVRFADKKIAPENASWTTLIPPNPNGIATPRYGLWLGYFHGNVPMSEKYFSGGFRFDSSEDLLFAVREVRAPSIQRAIQGLLLNKNVLAALLTQAVSATFPGAKIELSGKANSVKILNVPLKIVLPPTEFSRAVAESQKTFRITLAIAWFAGISFIGSTFALIVYTQKISDLRRLFSAAIAHDLRTPLARIDSQANLLAMRCDAKTARDAKSLQENIRQVILLAENLFWMAKTSHFRTHGLQLSEQRFGKVAEPIFERLADFLAKNEVELKAEISPEATDSKILVSPTALERIFVNLADNAAKQSAQNGNALVTISAHVPAGKKILYVYFNDNGNGMASSEKENLFREFTPGTSGLGIGLSLSRKLARAQNGNLSLHKTDATGTTFLLTLKIVS